VRDSLFGFDVGGQSVKAVVTDDRACITARGRRPTGDATTVESLAASIDELLGEVSRGQRPERLGVGIAGVVGRSGRLAGSPNMPRLTDRPIASELSSLLSAQVTVENDANCAAVAEGWHGAAQGLSDYLVVTLGTGLGSGLVLGGALYRGATGYACELGHSVVVADGRPCGCGNRGCLEAYASEAALRTMLRERGDDLTKAVVARVQQHGEGYTQALYALADGVIPDASLTRRASDVVEEMIRILGIGLASAVNVLDIDTIVLAGGIAPAVVRRIDRLRSAMGGALFARTVKDVAVLASVHGEDAGAIGAARLSGRAL